MSKVDFASVALLDLLFGSLLRPRPFEAMAHTKRKNWPWSTAFAATCGWKLASLAKSFCSVSASGIHQVGLSSWQKVSYCSHLPLLLARLAIQASQFADLRPELLRVLRSFDPLVHQLRH